MTPLLERFTAPADPEEPPVTTPRPRSFGAPWPWTGVCGLDPAMPVTDWATAAQCTAMACAAHVFGNAAGYAEKLFSRKGSPARQWADWLLSAVSDEDAARRRLALRLACEHSEALNAGDILEDAATLYASCSPGRR